MGEYAEMALEGCVCQWCGELIGDGEGVGYAVVCGGCQRAENVDEHGEPRGGKKERPAPVKTVACSQCTKKFATAAARDQHARNRHGSATLSKDPTGNGE